MANKLKGEVEVSAGEDSIVFRLGINELIELQDDLGIEDDEAFLSAFDNLRSLKKLRKVVFHAMKHARPDVTEIEAGDLITDLGSEKIRELIGDALKWALPQPEPRSPKAGKGPAASPGVKPS
jgi:hypothetical protein